MSRRWEYRRSAKEMSSQANPIAAEWSHDKGYNLGADQIADVNG